MLISAMRILRPSNQIVSPSTTQVVRSAPKQMPKLARWGSMLTAAEPVVAGPPPRKIARNSAAQRAAVTAMIVDQRIDVLWWRLASGAVLRCFTDRKIAGRC